ncbi:MAG: DUF1405 domain-containing protein [Candidatus Micrarchaeia archaeon]
MLFPLLVFAANFIAFFYGVFFFYRDQITHTNPLLTIFVPDCPLHAFLFGIAFLMVAQGHKLNEFYLIAFIGALKYGAWTIFVLLRYADYYLTYTSPLLYFLIFVGHIGLALETILLLGKFEVKRSALVLSLAWFLANDVSDYFFGTHPPMPAHAVGEIAVFTFALTLACSFFSYILIKKIGNK